MHIVKYITVIYIPIQGVHCPVELSLNASPAVFKQQSSNVVIAMTSPAAPLQSTLAVQVPISALTDRVHKKLYIIVMKSYMFSIKE